MLLLCLFAAPAFAQLPNKPEPSTQARMLVGVQGGLSNGSDAAGVLGGAEIPLGRHFEVDLLDNYSPLTSHAPYGTGWSNSGKVGAIVWASRNVGVEGAASYSNYAVKKLSKGSYFAFGGVVFRGLWNGAPVRIHLDYIRQFQNYMIRGTEPNYLQGGKGSVDVRIGCSGKFCYRLEWYVQGGMVKTQSNPQCDGAYPGVPITCPRGSVGSGGAGASFFIEFPRRKNAETELF